MKDEKKEIERLLKQAQDYFGEDEKIYIFKCKKCHKLDPVLCFIVSEQMGFLRFIKKKDTPKMECPYYNGTMVPIENFK